MRGSSQGVWVWLDNVREGVCAWMIWVGVNRLATMAFPDVIWYIFTIGSH